MSEIPAELKYTKTHEWARQEGEGDLTVGITAHAQELLGDVVYVELPEVGATVRAGGECMVVESVKAASDVYAPVEGEIIEVNTLLMDQPELINQEPYGDGWLFRLRPDSAAALDQLLDAKGYADMIAAES
ncbi:glycine cleavage system H protein [Nitrosococcus halophilus Nc 4]|uniref:Glycine cleavage system H protein n=1 Tax=Nitrosococcus halophilus (strain Nc4) TaxID=472759 RepID=D5BZ59_NITHN|nr:glycine cleavage system protein GcvH [Nitrosococcus halophilus]ADE14272.1 glycine cleavage system H protein [Nitrosococcus halophilus Nc 4]